MPLFLGSGQKLKINSNNGVLKLNLYSLVPILNGAKLLSSENYVLKDKNGLYLTVKEDK